MLATNVSKTSDTSNGLTRLAFQTNFSGSGTQNSTGVTQLAVLESRAAATVTFDQKSALPMAVDFDQILDSDPGHVIKVQTVFSDYRPEAGLIVPHRIQRYIQRTLQADITITSVNVE